MRKEKTKHKLLNTKHSKGITLVALIITIIVLLILAVVSIGAIKNSKIISHSQNAANKWKEEQENENELLEGYLGKIESSLPGGGSGGSGGTGSETTMPVATIDVVVSENSTINGEAYSSSNPVIPKGFKAINVTTEGHEWDGGESPQVSKGLVISDGTSEFVWIPVPSINAFARATSRTDANGNTNYQGVLYDFSGTTATEKTNYGQGTTNSREPANLNGYDSDTNISGWTATLYQERFNKMVKSVAEYGGFYVGRYETSMNANGTKAQSKSGETPMTYLNWYTMYTNSLTYSTTNTNLGVTSEMIWGCQWDAMLKFILTGDEASHVTVTINANHNLSSPYKTGGTDYSGTTTYNDIASNIYDLEGNVTEWTQEADGTRFRVHRGGSNDYSHSPSKRISGEVPTSIYNYFGSRLALYVDL